MLINTLKDYLFFFSSGIWPCTCSPSLCRVYFSSFYVVRRLTAWKITFHSLFPGITTLHNGALNRQQITNIDIILTTQVSCRVNFCKLNFQRLQYNCRIMQCQLRYIIQWCRTRGSKPKLWSAKIVCFPTCFPSLKNVA